MPKSTHPGVRAPPSLPSHQVLTTQACPHCNTRLHIVVYNAPAEPQLVCRECGYRRVTMDTALDRGEY